MNKNSALNPNARAMTLASFVIAFLLLAPHAFAESVLVFVGTYTQTTSKGIYSFRFNTSTGAVSDLKLVAEARNPSFLELNRDGRFLYAVSEIGDFGAEKSGSVTAFAVNARGGTLKQIDIAATRGEDPAHLALNPSGNWLVAANYTGGSLALFKVGSDGALGAAVDFVQRAGSSIHPQQKSAHPHQIVFGSTASFTVADLGTDELLSFKITDGKLRETGSVHVEPGLGPRHLAFDAHNRVVYVLGELQSSISVRTLPGFEEKQKVSMLPKDSTGLSAAAEIALHPNGSLLFASNRGLNEIAVFSIGAIGKLMPVGRYPTLGKTPRYFAIDPSGKYLLVANQDSDNIVVFRIDRQSGKLSDTGARLTLPMPVCLVFVKKQA